MNWKIHILLKNTSLSHRICSYFIDIQHLWYKGSVVHILPQITHAPSTICIILTMHCARAFNNWNYVISLTSKSISLPPLACFDTPHGSFTCYLRDSTKPRIIVIAIKYNYRKKSCNLLIDLKYEAMHAIWKPVCSYTIGSQVYTTINFAGKVT